MALQLLINGVDFTSKWRLFDAEGNTLGAGWTQRAHMGESAQSQFVLDDDDNSISHLDLAGRKIVEVWESASGSAKCMYRGRIANKTLTRGDVSHNNAMRWTIDTEDYNIDLRGVRVESSTRSAESDYTRFIAYVNNYLSGAGSPNPNARDTTDLGTSYVINADLVTLPQRTYTDVFPVGVFEDIVGYTDKTFFVFVDDAGDGQIYYASHTNTSFASDISITDAANAADGVDVYAPIWESANTDHGFQEGISGGQVRWGSSSFYEQSDIASGESFHDKWEEFFTDDQIRSSADAQALLIKIVQSRNNEDFTYEVTIQMKAEHAHRIKAGMTLSLRLASGDLTAATTKRAVQVTHIPIAPEWYEVTIQLGMPRGRPLRRTGNRNVPWPPVPATPGTCTRLYASSNGTTLTTAPGVHAGWDNNSSGAMRRLKTTADSTYGASSQSTSSDGGSVTGLNGAVWRGSIEMDSALAAVIAAGGTVRGQFRSRARYGTGINDGAQDMISNMAVRVTQGDSTTIRGVALAPHTSSTGSRWPAQATKVNKSFPPSGGTLAAVSGATAGDHLIIEIGMRNFTVASETSGCAINLMNSGAGDLPENESDTSTTLNAWIDICSGGSAGDTTSPVVSPGEEDPGDSNVYSPIDHTHSHGLLAGDSTHMHTEDQVQPEVTHSDSDPTVNDDEGDGYREGRLWINDSSGAVFVLVDATAGAAVWDRIDGGGTQDVRKNSTGSTFSRTRLNFIEGSNVTLTVADDAGNDEVDITIAASSGGSTSFVSIAKWGND